MLIAQVVEGQAAIHRCNATVDFMEDSHPAYPVTANSENEYNLFHHVAVDLVGEKNVVLQPPVMGAEDFSFYLQKLPGAYLLVGARDMNLEYTPKPHSPQFQINEGVLPNGAALLAAVAEKFLHDKAAATHQASS